MVTPYMSIIFLSLTWLFLQLDPVVRPTIKDWRGRHSQSPGARAYGHRSILQQIRQLWKAGRAAIAAQRVGLA
jgi:hypothetical protein